MRSCVVGSALELRKLDESPPSNSSIAVIGILSDNGQSFSSRRRRGSLLALFFLPLGQLLSRQQNQGLTRSIQLDWANTSASAAVSCCRAQKLHPCAARPPCRKPSSIRRLWPVNTFAENSRLYSPAMARLTPLMTMVETGLLVLELSVSCDSPAPSRLLSPPRECSTSSD